MNTQAESHMGNTGKELPVSLSQGRESFFVLPLDTLKQNPSLAEAYYGIPVNEQRMYPADPTRGASMAASLEGDTLLIGVHDQDWGIPVRLEFVVDDNQPKNLPGGVSSGYLTAFMGSGESIDFNSLGVDKYNEVLFFKSRMSLDTPPMPFVLVDPDSQSHINERGDVGPRDLEKHPVAVLTTGPGGQLAFKVLMYKKKESGYIESAIVFDVPLPSAVLKFMEEKMHSSMDFLGEAGSYFDLAHNNLAMATPQGGLYFCLDTYHTSPYIRKVDLSSLEDFKEVVSVQIAPTKAGRVLVTYTTNKNEQKVALVKSDVLSDKDQTQVARNKGEDYYIDAELVSLDFSFSQHHRIFTAFQPISDQEIPGGTVVLGVSAETVEPVLLFNGIEQKVDWFDASSGTYEEDMDKLKLALAGIGLHSVSYFDFNAEGTKVSLEIKSEDQAGGATYQKFTIELPEQNN